MAMKQMAMTALLSQLALGACSVVGIRDGTPEPAATVIGHVGRVEIRRYAPVLVAETIVEGGEQAVRAEGFRRLAAYIFGRNLRHAALGRTAVRGETASEKIAMTAPVAQSRAETPGDASGRSWVIRFFLPAGMTEVTAPRPLDPRVTLRLLPARTVAVLRFSGVGTPAAVSLQAAQLDAALASSDWRADGALVTWFYDPPWALPPFRRNEVARPVRPAAANGVGPARR